MQILLEPLCMLLAANLGMHNPHTYSILLCSWVLDTEYHEACMRTSCHVGPWPSPGRCDTDACESSSSGSSMLPCHSPPHQSTVTLCSPSNWPRTTSVWLHSRCNPRKTAAAAKRTWSSTLCIRRLPKDLRQTRENKTACRLSARSAPVLSSSSLLLLGFLL